MNAKLYKLLLVLVLTIGTLSIAAMVILTYLEYKDCSIISFIANGR